MKKLLLIFLFLSNYSIADITSIDERFTLLCQDDKVTGFKWKNDEWKQTNWTPNMTVIKKHDYVKSADDDDWIDDESITRACAFRQEGSNSACYSISQLGEEVGEWDYVSCSEWWKKDETGSKALKEVYCKEKLFGEKWEFQINGEFVAVKDMFDLSPSEKGIKDDIYIRVGKCSVL